MRDLADMMQYWPILAFLFSMFLGSVGTAVGAAMWLAGKMAEQDGKRIEVKEAILLEVRERSHSLYGRLDQQATVFREELGEVRDELKDLSIRVTRLEATANGHGRRS